MSHYYAVLAYLALVLLLGIIAWRIGLRRKNRGYESDQQKTKGDIIEAFQTPVKSLDIDSPVLFEFLRKRFNFAGEISTQTPERLLEIKGIQEEDIQDLEEALETIGLELGMVEHHELLIEFVGKTQLEQLSVEKSSDLTEEEKIDFNNPNLSLGEQKIKTKFLTPLMSLDLTSEVYMKLIRHGYFNAGNIAVKTKEELQGSIPDLSTTEIEEINEDLNDIGLDFGMKEYSYLTENPSERRSSTSFVTRYSSFLTSEISGLNPLEGLKEELKARIDEVFLEYEKKLGGGEEAFQAEKPED